MWQTCENRDLTVVKDKAEVTEMKPKSTNGQKKEEQWEGKKGRREIITERSLHSTKNICR